MIIELSDATSIFQNKMQTLTNRVSRIGKIANSGITLFFLENEDDEIFIKCQVGETATHLLLTKEGRLPFGDSRPKLLGGGFDFLFDEDNFALSPDLNDDDNGVKYLKTNDFHDSYSENPKRELFDNYQFECKLSLYYPNEGKRENVDGLAVIEIGNNLKENSGLLYYYNFRTIPNLDVSYLK